MKDEKTLFFNGYIVEEENEFASRAVFDAIMNMGKLYNPLFISGDSGNGKSTLMKMAADWAKTHNYSVKTVYAGKLQEAICNVAYIRLFENDKINFIDGICKRLKDADIVLIENLEILLEKPSILKEVFEVITYLVSKGKQVLVTSEYQLNKYEIAFEGDDFLEVSIPKLDSEFKFKLVRRFEAKFGLHLDILQTSIVVAKSRSIEDIEFVFKQITEMSKLVDIKKEEVARIVLTEYL